MSILTEFKYYKDDKGMLHAFASDGSQDAYIKDGMVLQEIEAVRDILIPPFNLTHVISNKSNELNILYSNKMADLVAQYPNFERTTWEIQLREAQAIIVDIDAITPWIDACIADRDIGRLEFAHKIITNDISYRVTSGKLTGIRQDHEKAIEAIKLLPEAAAKVAIEEYDVTANWP